MTMTSGHVLIVDDDLALLQALPEAMRLRMDEVMVDTSSSALTALGMIAQNDYDAIISDIKMPEMDGITLLAEIRSLRPETPTLLITGHGERDLAVQALRGGVYDFIQKPIDRDYFVASVNRAIDTRRLRRQIAEQQKALARHAQELEATVQERTRELREANALKDQLLASEQQARRMAEEAVRVRDQFLSIASHELKTPLTTLKATIQLLDRQLRQPDLDPDRLKAYGSRLRKELSRLEILVQDLLDASRIRQGQLELRPESVDLVQLAQQVLDRFDHVPERKPEHQLVLEVPKAITGYWDPSRLDQVFTNLVSNALKYSPEGGEVRLSIHQSDSHALVAVSDRGIGMASDDQERLFQPFARSDDVRDSVAGVGLGLYITARIVEQHGGVIKVQSEPGNGSTFTVRLPLTMPDRSETATSSS
jgi:two-component system sensor histidine kinase/response regulator